MGRFAGWRWDWLVLLFVVMFPCALSASWFQIVMEYVNPAASYGPLFDGDQLYDITKLVGLSNVAGRVSCFGDFDSDSYTDLIITSENGRRVIVYTWDHEEFEFKESKASVTLDGTCVAESVAASDFNHDGKLDVLVSASNCTPLGMSPAMLRHLLFLGDRSTLVASNPGTPAVETLGPVLIMDYDGDMHPDLFGESRPSSDSERGVRSFWTFNVTTRLWDVYAQNESALTPLGNFALPYSANAYVDLDGDCKADLYVTSETGTGTSLHKQVEVWSHLHGNFKRERVFHDVTSDLGQPVFADFDSDGTTDILFPFGNDTLYIVYNDQKELCEHYWSKGCRSNFDLCSRDSSFLRGDQLFAQLESTPKVDIVTLSGLDGSMFSRPFSPIILRSGDYNLDGYPDLLIPVKNGSTQSVQLWENKKCDRGDCQRRTFRQVKSDVAALEGVQNAHAAAFFDVDENGSLDIIVLNGTNGGPEGTSVLYNNFHNDAFFLKTVGLNGVCSSWCNHGEKFPDPKPIGVNHPGGVFKFTITDYSGKKTVRHASQLTQSAYSALQTPYNVFGLGRASNYVEEFFYGVLTSSGTHFKYWICIIPNSQLRVFPTGSASSWLLELYLRPSNMTIWVVGVMILTLLVLGGVIFAFWKWQKRQDRKEKEKKEKLSGFSFKAL